MLKLKVIACDVLNREISYISSRSKCFVDVTFMRQGLHNNPNEMRIALQREIDNANDVFPYSKGNKLEYFDFIILGYGLCGNGIAGLKSGLVPLVVPRAHDCTTLLLGSKERYNQAQYNGNKNFIYSLGWIERGFAPNEESFKKLYARYVEKYGEDNAGYLIEMEHNWTSEYKNAEFVSWPYFDTLNESYREFTKNSAEFFKWGFIETLGSPSLLEHLLNGKFMPDETLILPPNSEICQSYSNSIIDCKS